MEVTIVLTVALPEYNAELFLLPYTLYYMFSMLRWRCNILAVLVSGTSYRVRPSQTVVNRCLRSSIPEE